MRKIYIYSTFFSFFYCCSLNSWLREFSLFLEAKNKRNNQNIKTGISSSSTISPLG